MIPGTGAGLKDAQRQSCPGFCPSRASLPGLDSPLPLFPTFCPHLTGRLQPVTCTWAETRNPGTVMIWPDMSQPLPEWQGDGSCWWALQSLHICTELPTTNVSGS